MTGCDHRSRQPGVLSLGVRGDALDSAPAQLMRDGPFAAYDSTALASLPGKQGGVAKEGGGLFGLVSALWRASPVACP